MLNSSLLCISDKQFQADSMKLEDGQKVARWKQEERKEEGNLSKKNRTEMQ